MTANDPQLRALEAAISDHDQGRVAEIVAQGVDLNREVRNRHTPLSLAVTFHDEQIVKLLLDAGADAAFRGDEGETALHHAAVQGHPGIVRQLIDRGADVIRTPTSRTPAISVWSCIIPSSESPSRSRWTNWGSNASCSIAPRKETKPNATVAGIQ
jgi:ankyrin repeat protein